MKSEVHEYQSLKYIPGLDGLRAISILLVMVFHFIGPYTKQMEGLGLFWKITSQASSVGWIGVDIFFVISGLLMGMTIQANPINTFSKFWAFLKRRSWRLLPAYFIFLLIFNLVGLLIDPNSKVLRNQIFLWTFSANIESSFGDRVALADQYFSLVHFWSLAVEWHFYLLLPILFFVTRTIKGTAIFLLFLAIGTRFFLYHFGFSDNATYSFTLCRLDAFAGGLLLSDLTLYSRPKRITKAVGLIGSLMLLGALIEIVTTGNSFKTIPWLQTIGYTLLSVSISLIIFYIIQAKNSFLVSRCLESPLLKYFGKSSYSIYIWHLAFFPILNSTILSLNLDLTTTLLLSFFVSFCLSLILGVLSFLLIEEPLLVFSKRNRVEKISPIRSANLTL